MLRNQSPVIASIAILSLAPLLTMLAQAQSSTVTIARPDADSPAVQAQVISVLQSIPRIVRERVFDKGCKIVIVPTVPDYTGAGYQDKPRGYTDGGGYDNADGLFRPAQNEILVAERVSYRNSPPEKANRIPYVLSHEFGHAFDQYLGKSLPVPRWAASSMPRFLATHTQEVRRLSNTDKTILGYFCQEGESGASETFAELFCLHCQPQRTNRQTMLLAKFPATDAMVRYVMSNPDQVSTWDDE